MSTSYVEKWAGVAGIGGIGVGAATLVFRDVIAKEIFSTLPPQLTYELLRLIVILAFALGAIGLVGWLWLQRANRPQKTVEKAFHAVGDALADVERLNEAPDLFLCYSWGVYTHSPTPENWFVALSDMRLTWDKIQRAKDAVANCAALLGRGEEFKRVAALLSQQEARLAGFLSQKEPPPPEPGLFRALQSDYFTLCGSLRDETRRLRKTLPAA